MKNPKEFLLITVLLMTVQLTQSLKYADTEEDPISGSSQTENEFWSYIKENENWIAGIVLASGLFLCLFGHHFFSITLFLVTFYFVFEIVIVFTNGVILNNTGCESNFCFWMTVGSAAALGFIGGCIAFQVVTVGLLVLGGCGGWYLGVLSCTAFHIET